MFPLPLRLRRRGFFNNTPFNEAEFKFPQKILPLAFIIFTVGQ